MRALTDWECRVALDGAWDDRKRKSPSYRAELPYPIGDVAAAFEVLRRIFSRERVSRELLRADHENVFSWMTAALNDPWRADVSALVPFALDVLDGCIEHIPALVRDLQGPDHFDHRANVEVIAGLVRGEIPCRFEPRADEVTNEPGRHPNPDLLVNFGVWVPVEIKRLRMAERAMRAMNRMHLVLNGPLARPTPIGLATEFLPLFTQLERSVDCEARFDAFCARLNCYARARAEEMRRAGIAQSVVGGVLRLHLRDPRECTFFGPTLEHPADARRVVEVLDKAAGQISPEVGLVVVVPDMTIGLADLGAAITEWLRGPAEEVLGVVVLHDDEVEGFEVSVRVPSVLWRESVRSPSAARVQRALQRGPWHRFFGGLNARRWQLSEARRDRSRR